MIKDTISQLRASAASLNDAGKKKELLGLVDRLEADLGELQDKHADLRLSLKGFESKHPQLTEAVNELAGFLAKLGI